VAPLFSPRPHSARPGTPVLDVVVPVYNEQVDLEPSVRRRPDGWHGGRCGAR
jgi:hypothetical protein